MFIDCSPLEGITILTMEQAAALPFATRHLADLGARVIRVQSHHRPSGGLADGDLTRSKEQVAIDLSTPDGAATFLRIAAVVDVVAHNFTPRVARKFEIDFEHVCAVNPDVIYVSTTGFGLSGPWSELPLFGPGAEAVSGIDELVGQTDSASPGRPGTVVYVDNTAGLNLTFAVLAALEIRDVTSEAQLVDLSLYESAVSHLGPVIAESQAGTTPVRYGNHDQSFALHGVFRTAGIDRYIAIAVSDSEMETLQSVLGASSTDSSDIAATIEQHDRDDLVLRIQETGLKVSEVADAADLATSQSFWERGYFGLMQRARPPLVGGYPHAGPPWGGGRWIPMREPHVVGEDTWSVLQQLVAVDDDELARLYSSDTVGEGSTVPVEARSLNTERRIERGELSRVDPPGAWKPFLGVDA